MDTSQAVESFRGLALRHRGRTGLTQRELAIRMGAGRRTVQDWEAGVKYPSAERLQALIVVLLAAGGLTAGDEREEVAELWAAVLREAPRMRTPFDEVWFTGLLADHTAPLQTPAPAGHMSPAASGRSAAESRAVERREDWGEAPDVLDFVGRVNELATLRGWVLEERCRLVAVLGMGGIGKTTLAARLAQDLATTFQRLYWRSLRDALPPSEWLAGAIGFLSDQLVVPPEGEAARLAVLLQLLRDRPSLLVLDNFDTLMEPRQRDGRYRDGYAGYGRLLQAVGEGRHHSCLVVTSRESPPDLEILGGAVRTLQLGGLGVAEGQVLLADKQLSGSKDEWADLVARYGGNGLALKVVGESIRQVFSGDVGAFLDESGSGTVFGGIRRLLAEQIERSSALEREVLRVLAAERQPVTFAELLAALDPRAGRGTLLEAVAALRRRSLVERAETTGRTAFTLQSVVLEYVTDRLVEEVGDEIARGQPVRLVDQPLIKAQAKDYVRNTQERLIGEPILQHLEMESGHGATEQRLLALLDGWRYRPEAEQGYGPGNVVNLLRLARGDLRCVDLTHLALRQAYLADVEAQDASLAGAHLSEAVLAESFNYPISVALSSDGTSLVAGTAAGEVWLWRVADRRPQLAIQAHTGPVYAVTVSADLQLLASGGLDGKVRLWEVPGGRLLATLHGHIGTVWGVSLSADGGLLASGGMDGTVRLWAVPGGQPLATLEGHTGTVCGVALSADGRLLASGGFDGTVRLWDPRFAGQAHSSASSAAQGAPRGQLLATLQGQTGGLWSVALSADGRLVASGGFDGTVRLWETQAGQLLTMLQGHTGGVRSVALSADGGLLASGSGDETVRLWETSFASPDRNEQFAERSADTGDSPAAPSSGGRLLATLQAQISGVWGVALTADGRLLASGGLDGTVRLWETPGGRVLAMLQGHTGGVWGVSLSTDGRLLASGSQDGTVRLWETASGRLLATQQDQAPAGAGHASGVWGVSLSADGRLLASGGLDGMVRLSETQNRRSLATLDGHKGGVWGVSLSADGRLLASGGFDGTVRLWEAPGGRLLAAMPGHAGGVWGLALSTDGRLLASGGFDGTVRLWDTLGRRLLAILQGHTSGVRGVALSADGRLLASGGFDGAVRLWDTRFALADSGEQFAERSADSGDSAAAPSSGGRLLATLHGHAGTVWGVALSSDGRLLASSGMDGTVRVWEAPTGQPLATLEGHTGPVCGVAMSADGRVLASGSWDGTVRLWDARSGAGLRTLRSDRRYERVDITGLTGVTAAQRAAMLALGAVEHQDQVKRP